MKPEQILEAISYVDEELLLKSENGKGDFPVRPWSKATEDTTEETADHPGSRKSKILHWRRWTTLAACACLLLVFVTIAPNFFYMGSSSSSSSSASYDVSDEAAETAEDTDSAVSSNSAVGSNSADGFDASDGSDSAVWVTAAGFDYRELTFDGSDFGTSDAIITDYGIEEAEAENIPETDIGECLSAIDDASEESLIGENIYRSNSYEDLYIIATEDGYRYFYKE